MDVSKLFQLKPEEEVFEIIREDFAPHSLKFFLIGLWFVVPFFFLFPLFQIGIIGVIIFIVLIGSAFLIGLRSFRKWNNTVMIITDRRIVDVEQNGFFDRVVTEVSFPQIDEVSYRVKGFFPTILRIGVITVKTTGNAADIEFKRMRRPARLHDLINDLRETILDEKRERKKKQINDLAESMSMDEIKQLARQVRRKEQHEAMEEMFSDE